MADAAIVQTDSGPVRGTVTGEYRLFQGIRGQSRTAAPVRPDDPLLSELRAHRRSHGDGLPPWSPFDRADAVPYVQSFAPDAVSSVDYATEHYLDSWSQLPQCDITMSVIGS